MLRSGEMVQTQIPSLWWRDELDLHARMHDKGYRLEHSFFNRISCNKVSMMWWTLRCFWLESVVETSTAAKNTRFLVGHRNCLTRQRLEKTLLSSEEICGGGGTCWLLTRLKLDVWYCARRKVACSFAITEDGHSSWPMDRRLWFIHWRKLGQTFGNLLHYVIWFVRSGALPYC